MASDKTIIKCSFCGRDKRDTSMLIAGITGHICDKCIDQAYAIVREESTSSESKNLNHKITLLKPIEIKNHLDEYIIGQDASKKVLSVAVYNHYKRIMQKPTKGAEDVEIEKSNIIMVGETGTGKT